MYIQDVNAIVFCIVPHIVQCFCNLLLYVIECIVNIVAISSNIVDNLKCCLGYVNDVVCHILEQILYN
jgi:hypothetical protein